MTVECKDGLFGIGKNPPVDREYIEIYPVNWIPMNGEMATNILTTRSHKDIKEISLYVHMPFCQTLCSFCKFNIIEYNHPLYQSYIDAINTEISLFKSHPDIDDRKVTAVYFGGGTGSTLKPPDVARVLGTINGIFDLDEKVEITMECHPNTVGEKRFKEYREVGINRISLGIQSFQDKNLQEIGRNHSAERNLKVLGAALNTGFQCVAMDLMYRLPNQDFENLYYDLRMIEKMQPSSISAYSLDTENTVLENKNTEMPGDDMDKEMFYAVGDFLEQKGYIRFMQPDFAKPGKESKYVVNAWRAPQQLMLGIGAGADTHYFGGHVWANVYPVESYIKAVKNGFMPAVAGVQVSTRELMSRYMVLGVRSMQIDKHEFKNMFGISPNDVFGEEILLLRKVGWLEETENVYQLSREGIYFVDNISKLFYSQDNRGEKQPWGKDLYAFTPDRFYGQR